MELIAAGLWNKPIQTEPFAKITPSDWQELADMAHKQNLHVLVADQVLSLPPQALPRQEVRARFQTYADEKQVADTEMPAHSEEEHIFFLFNQLLGQFMYEGVGLQKLCDWVLFLQQQYKKIDFDVFAESVRSKKILYSMQVFASVAVQYLDAPPEIFPFVIGAAKKRHVRAVAKDLLKANSKFIRWRHSYLK